MYIKFKPSAFTPFNYFIRIKPIEYHIRFYIGAAQNSIKIVQYLCLNHKIPALLSIVSNRTKVRDNQITVKKRLPSTSLAKWTRK